MTAKAVSGKIRGETNFTTLSHPLKQWTVSEVHEYTTSKEPLSSCTLGTNISKHQRFQQTTLIYTCQQSINVK